MYYTVYKTTNLINGKIYVGMHKTNNLDDGYMGSGKIFKRALEKYGIENFKKEYLEVFDNPEDMFQMESQIVNEDFVNDEQTYNLKVGGEGGWDFVNANLTERQRKEIAQIGGLTRHISKEDWLKLTGIGIRRAWAEGKYDNVNFNNSRLGIPHSEETKKKMSESSKGKGIGKTNSQYGTCWIYHIELKENKKIKKEDLDLYSLQGWIKGRKIKF